MAYVIALDAGTTGVRALAISEDSQIKGWAYREFTQFFPQPGWVEHDATEIWESIKAVIAELAPTLDQPISAIGITNQRETVVAWDRKSGEPRHNAIVWQDRRTAKICAKLKADHNEQTDIREKTGLLLDPYFSATKLAWILDHVDGARERANKGELAFGTVDSFLIWRLTGGASHYTDATNASRTNLYNIKTGMWDADLCALFKVPQSVLPTVKDCAADFGMTSPNLLGSALPILGVAGDQQAALIGQTCFTPGQMKSTYGTGCFMMLNTGENFLLSKNRLLSTVAYRLNGKTTYALEGSIFMAGATIQWLRDGLGLIKDARETEAIAAGMNSNQGVYLVPAHAGLGAPYWEPDARAAIFGLTRGSGKNAIIRAGLEAVAYQTQDLLSAMIDDGATPKALRIDGGMVANDWLCQFMADILALPVQRPKVMETTALGAAYLAGLKAGIYAGQEDLSSQWQIAAEFTPQMGGEPRADLLNGWAKAVKKLLSSS